MNELAGVDRNLLLSFQEWFPLQWMQCTMGGPVATEIPWVQTPPVRWVLRRRLATLCRPWWTRQGALCPGEARGQWAQGGTLPWLMPWTHSPDNPPTGTTQPPPSLPPITPDLHVSLSPPNTFYWRDGRLWKTIWKISQFSWIFFEKKLDFFWTKKFEFSDFFEIFGKNFEKNVFSLDWKFLYSKLLHSWAKIYSTRSESF